MVTQPTLDDAAHPLSDILDALDIDVPAWIAKAAAWDAATRHREADRCADVIAHYADTLWYETKPKRGAPRSPSRQDVLDAIACGAGILALRAGGVHLADRHWCLRAADCAGCTADLSFDFDRVEINASRTGAHFTPKWMALHVTAETLSALTRSPGPLDDADRDQWRPAAPHTWWPARVVDIACGSGAFLLAAARFLAQEISDGLRLHKPDSRFHPGAQVILPMVIEGCLYGADINPWSVDLARLAVGLLVPNHPTPNLDRRLLAGDTLAGVAHSSQVAADLDERFPHRYPIHWWDVFPEVFAPGQSKGRGFDAVVGNPPFLGGNKITGLLGTDYRNYLVKEVAFGTRGSADLSAYFLLRAHFLVHGGGQVGLIATNSLAQGDTREVGLKRLGHSGVTIRSAMKSAPWPGSAQVHYCMVVTSRAHMHADARYYLYDSIDPAAEATQGVAA